MIFRPDLAELVMAGGKTQTRRALSDNPNSPWWRERCALRPGRSYAICPGRGRHAIGRVVVDAVEKVRLGDVTNEDAVAEGFADRDRFAEAWTAINGAWTPDAYVWRLTFHVDSALTPPHRL